MVLYKTVLEPSELEGFSVNEDNQVLFDYTLLNFTRLDTTYSEVYIKSIRFIIAYPKFNEGKIPHPLQFHLNWNEGDFVPFQRGTILQVGLHDGTTPGEPLVFSEGKSKLKPSYSTFVHADFYMETKEPEGGGPEQWRWHFYSMERNALIKSGNVTNLQFEVYFTTLNGERMYQNIPNVEIEFELF